MDFIIEKIVLYFTVLDADEIPKWMNVKTNKWFRYLKEDLNIQIKINC